MKTMHYPGMSQRFPRFRQVLSKCKW